MKDRLTFIIAFLLLSAFIITSVRLMLREEAVTVIDLPGVHTVVVTNYYISAYHLTNLWEYNMFPVHTNYVRYWHYVRYRP